MTSKQRSHLKSLAATMKPIAQVGKEGVSDNLIASLSDALEARELIKINLLPAAGRRRRRARDRNAPARANGCGDRAQGDLVPPLFAQGF